MVEAFINLSRNVRCQVYEDNKTCFIEVNVNEGDILVKNILHVLF